MEKSAVARDVYIQTIIVQQPQRVKLKFLHPPETGWQCDPLRIMLWVYIHREEPGHPLGHFIQDLGASITQATPAPIRIKHDSVILIISI